MKTRPFNLLSIVKWVIDSADAGQERRLTLPVHRGITVADKRQSLPISDYKTRGFQSRRRQIERTDGLDQLVLVLSLALCLAVSTGMWDAMQTKRPAKHPRSAKTLRAA